MTGDYSMKNRYLKRLVPICMAIALAFNSINVSAAVLRKGSRGSEVKNVQMVLKEKGYYTYAKTTGYYGSITKAAVKQFQKSNNLEVDGIVGKQTVKALFKDTNKKAISDFSYTDANEDSKKGALDWFSEVQYLWPRDTNATVTDVDTGKSFKVKRTYGTNHADVEPLSKKDSAIIKDIWGGFSWERRAVIVQVGTSKIAGSMTAMPHAGADSSPAENIVNGRSCSYGRGQNLDAVKNNGCSGVMDIHFKNSKTHNTNKVQKVQQDMVMKAAKYID